MPRKVTTKKKKVASKKIEKSEVTIDDKEAKKYIDTLRKEGLLGDIHKKVDYISTGSWVVDKLVSDTGNLGEILGIPRGYITEICGDESAGKTTLALGIAKQVLMQNEIALYCDFEQSLRIQYNYVRSLGIDTSSPNFVHLTPPSLQDGAKHIGNSLIKLRPAVVIIDSIAAMIPKEVMDKDADETTQIGQHARLIGSFINWIGKKLQKYNTALVVINQYRSAIKGQYDPGPREITTGGKALQYFLALRIAMKKTSKREEVKVKNNITGVSENKKVNQQVKCVIEKNKFAKPYNQAHLYITFGEGIDNLLSQIKLAIETKLIKQRGAFYLWEDPSDQHSFKVNGKAAVKQYLMEHPDTFEAMRVYLNPERAEEELDAQLSELESMDVEEMTNDQKEELEQLRKIGGASRSDDDLTDSEMEDLDDLESLTDAMGELSESEEG
jgi:recombination protein RecA